LVRAFGKHVGLHPKSHLHLVGALADQVYVEELRKLIKKLALGGKVTLHGQAARSTVLKMLRNGDCLVLPSITEGCSIALAEGLLAGIAIIATDVGSIPEIKSNFPHLKVIPGIVDDIIKLNGDNCWSTLRAAHPAFEDRLTTAFNEVAVSPRVSRSPQDERPKSFEIFDQGRMIHNYIRIFSNC
jgi:glycosyltransferase involved in cell wall biosynthesis